MPIKDWNGAAGMEDPNKLWANVAQCIGKLRTNSTTTHEKELVTEQFLSIAKEGKDARTSIYSHSQAFPLLVALLKYGTTTAKVNVASNLEVLCKEEELRIKVLLGGCIPHLLGLLRVGLVEAQKAAAKAIYAVSCGGLIDHVWSKIFVTECVVPCLWDQLCTNCQDKLIGGLLTRALRNLYSNAEGFLQATFEAGGVEILVRLLFSGSPVAQANASYLLADLILASETSRVRVNEIGTIKSLLKLLGPENDLSVRAEAAGALQALSSKLDSTKKSLVDAGGIPVFISAILAPSKEFSYGTPVQALQENAMGALANISGGMSRLVHSLGESIRSFNNDVQVSDIIGVLAYTSKVFNEPGSVDSVNVVELESLLIKQLEPSISKLVQRRAFEALSCLYGNAYLHRTLWHAESKELLVGLVTTSNSEVQEELTFSLRFLSTTSSDIWESLKGREGVQLLISLLGLSTKQQQEYVVAWISILSMEFDEGKWAIKAAGGIPPLVQLLEIGSVKAKEISALVLRNLCCHNEDIPACVQSAEVVPALLHLLENADIKGQKIAAEALRHLIRDADPSTFYRLEALLLGDRPESKVHLLEVCGCLLSLASHGDILHESVAANKVFQMVLEMLGSSNGDIQENVASVLANVFDARRDLSEILGRLEITGTLCNLLSSGTECIAMQSAQALAAIFLSIETNKHMAFIAKDAIMPLINLAKSSNIYVAEMAITAFANLLLELAFILSPLRSMGKQLKSVLLSKGLKGQLWEMCFGI